MNYQRIYDQIIDRAKKENREKGRGTYYEAHHILPKCFGGSNKKENLILLTGREHFLVHWILTRLYPENHKISYAFWAMCNLRNERQEERYIPSSRAFSEAKELKFATGVAFLKAFNKTQEGRESRARAVTKIDYKKVVANTDWAARTLNFDYTARALKQNKPILQLNVEGVLIRKWPSATEAGEALKISKSSISSCLTGRYSMAGGFIWKYFKK